RNQVGPGNRGERKTRSVSDYVSPSPDISTATDACGDCDESSRPGNFGYQLSNETQISMGVRAIYAIYRV
ncbi:MAG TPA: hypothetical protein PLD41_13815, partial [Casimicrobium huifangae]|nr:hypothetical protein [Casimicrobium huifangae]